MKQKENENELSVYVHIPFCVQKCLYCDFLSGPATNERVERYLAALRKEIGWYDRVFEAYKIRSVFLGGGTPSILTKEQISRLMTELTKNLHLKSETSEITIEANPGTLTEEKLEVYQKCGINRISIGLQSANAKELKLLGRIHTYEEFLESFEMARKSGFANINVDLMSGLPSRSMDTYMNTLNQVIALNPEHISAYSLIIEEGTPFYEKYCNGSGQNMLLDDEQDREMYHRTKDVLLKAGFSRYEISNYAKAGFESKHNISYWTGIPYIGLGLGASSLYGGKRYHNESLMENYLNFVETRSKMTVLPDENFYMPGSSLEEILTREDEMDEFMILGLRMEKGVSLLEFEERFGVSLKSVYPEPLMKFLHEKLLREEDGKLALSERGIDISNQVFMEFLRK